MAISEDGRLARGAARRELLLEAAVRVVAASGSGSLTHRAVATEAQVSIASVTYHFASIGELRRETLQHAGSSIGFELVGLIQDASASVEDTPQICAAFAIRLVDERRIETAAVFELIVAAGHDEELRPVVAALNGYLADLLTPYEGDRSRALAVGAAIQGLLLVHLTGPSPSRELGAAIADLITRYRTTPN
jgi:DNA-binding transcriptional regulator YbjK